MRQMKIVIKCEGLCVRTKDLGMGLSILNRIANNGIMKHTFVSNVLLSKAIKVIDQATSAGTAAKNLIQKTKESFQAGFTPVTKTEAVTTTEKSKKKSFNMIMKNDWTIDEDKFVADRIHISAKKLATNKELLKRHTTHAIKTRHSMIKNHRFNNMQSDRGKMMKAYLENIKIETPIADITKAENITTKSTTPKKGGKLNYWTPEELELMKQNLNIPIKELAKLFPNRTQAGVIFKKRMLLGKVRNSSAVSTVKKTKSKQWTEDETNAISLNMDMMPAKLAKLPWLKDRSIQQISQKRWALMHKGDDDFGNPKN